MTNNGYPYEKPIVERVNGILKTEWLYDMSLKDYDQVKKRLSNQLIISIITSVHIPAFKC